MSSSETWDLTGEVSLSHAHAEDGWRGGIAAVPLPSALGGREEAEVPLHLIHINDGGLGCLDEVSSILSQRQYDQAAFQVYEEMSLAGFYLSLFKISRGALFLALHYPCIV